MNQSAAIAVVGTFDSKAEEHLFLKERIELRGFRTLTIHVGTKSPSPFPVDNCIFFPSGFVISRFNSASQTI